VVGMSEHQTHVEKLITFVITDGRFEIQLLPSHTPIVGKLYRLKVAIPEELLGGDVVSEVISEEKAK
jgi:hypothetical protein